MKLRDSFMQSLNNRSTFGHPHKCGKKVWFEEYDKAFLNKEGPGPAHYNPNDSVQSVYLNQPQHKFSTSSRWMLIKEEGSKSSRRSSKSKL